MKNRTSILVGTRHFFYALLAVVILQSCKFKTPTCEPKKSASNWENAEIVVTESSKFYSVSAVDYYSNGMHYKVFNSECG